MRVIGVFLLLLGISHAYCAGEKRLKIPDVRGIMEEMLIYHVEHKEMSSLLMRRAFKIYIEQFDPYRVYLLQQEVEPFFDPNPRLLQASTSNFRSDNLYEFIQLNLMIQMAIERARAWRREIQKEFILNDPSYESAGESYLGYARNEKQLKGRIYRQLLHLLLEEKKTNQIAVWTPEQRARIFQLWQRRLQRKEDPYLIFTPDGKFLGKEREENLFCIHSLHALAKSLDAHTAYFSTEEASGIRTSLEKQFEGVGVVLREGLDGVIISELITGGPAERSGKVEVGDLLVEIDEKAVYGISYEQILDIMRGNGKREIQLGLKRAANQEIVRVRLAKEKIIMQEERLQVSVEPFADGAIAKLVLPSFYEGGFLSSAEEEIRQAIKKLKKETNLKGLILDLRDNAGGFLTQAVKIAGLFITRGVIVVSKYAHGEMRYLRDIDGRIFYDGPLVILTSKGSASAAEIVAQALQDYGTAVIVGDERTYGKGTIQYQTVTDDNAKSFFKVTVGRYYTVSGRSTQIDGVKADILVPTEYAPFNIGERFLEYPLASDRIPPAYEDSLNDIEERNKAWFQKNYLPFLQKQKTFWQKALPQLSNNSSYRINHNKNFVLFLQDQERYQGLSLRAYSKPQNPPWGNDDLQMIEAINILQDMIQLESKGTRNMAMSAESMTNLSSN